MTPMLALLNRRFLARLLSTSKGRAHVLAQAADAESEGEAGVFDRTLELVDDEALQKLIVRHKADEVRHAALFHARAVANQAVLPKVPAELRVLDKLNAALGGFFDRPLDGASGVAEAYLILQVIEERAVTQFELMQPVFARFDPESAAVFKEIAKDEERHLKYCRAIAKRYLPDEAETERRLARIRAVEAQVYAENSRANLRHVLSRGLLDVGPVEKLAWRALAALGDRREQPDFTRFAAPLANAA